MATRMHDFEPIPLSSMHVQRMAMQIGALPPHWVQRERSSESQGQYFSDLSAPLSWLPRSESMEVTNDPRFLQKSVISKRLTAFQTISVVAVLMVNLSVKQMFLLQKDIHIRTFVGIVQYTGFLLMTIVLLMDLFTVIVVVQQFFMTYRLLTAGPTGFEVAKSFYLNPNIVTLRHMAVRAFLLSLPMFVASTGCMVFVVFDRAGAYMLAVPAFVILGIGTAGFIFVNVKHSSIFRERYIFAKTSEQPLLSHIEPAPRNVSQGSFMGLDV
eukprot:CAMPEP_0179073176 /NCGR_PEP_ID=MMETSP0796-20121207/32436_1 /TAXON_ID=73915 /ORGANISM="Pyrodinium bahamense, Strain pbaha01" /LENGTH=268 /DNA_ID=CAMNT_0020770361 /DNA_START=24 /DNA_END=830 /DNA_ORIENTATION=-